MQSDSRLEDRFLLSCSLLGVNEVLRFKVSAWKPQTLLFGKCFHFPSPVCSAPIVSDGSIINGWNHCWQNPQSPPLLTHQSWCHFHISHALTLTGLALWNWIWFSCKTSQNCVFSFPFRESEWKIVVVVQGHVIFLARWVPSSAVASGAEPLSFWGSKIFTMMEQGGGHRPSKRCPFFSIPQEHGLVADTFSLKPHKSLYFHTWSDSSIHSFVPYLFCNNLIYDLNLPHFQVVLPFYPTLHSLSKFLLFTQIY